MTERARAMLAGTGARRSGEPPTPGFVPIREPDTGKLLFRYDPTLMVLEIVRRQRRTLVDLRTGRVLDGNNRLDTNPKP